MQEKFLFIKSNIFNIISLLFGLIGIILAVIFYYKSRKIKRPVYTLSSFNLFNSELKKIENLEVKYLGKTIKNLTATKFIFWNAGKGTIDRNDIPEMSRLSIKTKGDVILYGAEVIYATDNTNQVQLLRKEHGNEIIIDFEYLDYYQGAIIKILHSGDSSVDLEILGKVKGVGNFKISEINPVEEPIANRIMLSIFTIVLFIGGIFAKKISWKIVLISLALLFSLVLFKSLTEAVLPKNLRNQFNK
jgi:hypothetical protein